MYPHDTASVFARLKAAHVRHPTRDCIRVDALLCELGLRRPTDEDHPNGGPNIPLAYQAVDGSTVNRHWAGYHAELTVLPPAGEPRPRAVLLPPSSPNYALWLERERRWLDNVWLPWTVLLPGESKIRMVLRACAWHEGDSERYLELSWDPESGMDRYTIADMMSDHAVATLRGLLTALRGDGRPAPHRPLNSGIYTNADEFHAAVRAAYEGAVAPVVGRLQRPPRKSDVIAIMGIQASTFYRYCRKWPLRWPPK